jgi:hypothetical protein
MSAEGRCSFDSPDKWFEMVFGFPETLKNVCSKIDVEEQPDEVLMTARIGPGTRTFSAGAFHLCSCASFTNTPLRGQSAVTLIGGQSHSGHDLDYSDFLVLQSLPEFNGATFHVQSTLNCLQFIGPTQTAAIGITTTIYDRTQGAVASLSASPAFLYRNYFVPHADGRLGQIGRELDLLGDTPIRVEHGHAVVRERDIPTLSRFDWSDLTHYRVGIQRNCQVALARRGRTLHVVTRPQFVHQVFTGAISFAGPVLESDLTRGIAQQLMTAGYRAAVLAAWENSALYPEPQGARRCVLAIAGNQANRNPVAVACRGIAACEDLLAQAGLEVFVVCGEDIVAVQAYLGRFAAATGGGVLSAG